jgi:hypothetical protein
MGFPGRFFTSFTGMVVCALIGVGIINTIKMSQQAPAPAATPGHTPSTTARPVIPRTADPATPLPAPSQATTAREHARKQQIYAQLQTTCQNWTRWYNDDQRELSRVNMNAACRDAANYARNELNQSPGAPNHVAYSDRPSPSAHQGAAVTTVGGGSVAAAPPSSQCEFWQAEKEVVQARLRAGYREDTGNHLRARRRELTDLINANC